MNEPADELPQRYWCERCRAELVPGRGDFYLVRILAMADPTPPSFTAEALLGDPRQEIGRLIDQLSRCTEEELLNQVYRRMTIYLCGRCYRAWIENPVGWSAEPPRP